jgi:hypothetical protein
MGEYIEPAATSLVDEAIRKPDNEDSIDSVAFPPLGGTSYQEALVLSWVLLLFRGTVHSEDGGFSWSDGAKVHNCLLTDVIESEKSSLKDVLGRIQERFSLREESVHKVLLQNSRHGTEVSKAKTVLCYGC